MPFNNDSDFNAKVTPLKRSQFVHDYINQNQVGVGDLIITESGIDIITESGEFLETE